MMVNKWNGRRLGGKVSFEEQQIEHYDTNNS